MNLLVQTPVNILISSHVLKVMAEGENGYFCLLPNHIDFVSTLKAGILSFEIPGGKTEYIAVDEGVLVKKGGDVFLSVRNFFKGEDLSGLKNTVEEVYEKVDQEEKRTREIFAKFEGDITRLIQEQK